MSSIYKYICILLPWLFGGPCNASTIRDVSGRDSFELYCRLAREHLVNEPDQSVAYAKKAMKQPVGKNDATLPYYQLGLAYKNLALFDSALFYFDKCYGQRLRSKFPPKYIAEVIIGKGIVHSLEGKFDKALECFLETQKIFEDIHDSVGIARGLNNIANIYYSTGKPDKALKYYLRSLEMKEKLRIKMNTDASLINISTIYTEKEEYGKAQQYLEMALAYAIEVNNQYDLGIVYNKLGTLYSAKKEHELAVSCYRKSIAVRKNLQDEYGTAESLLDLGTCYNKMQKRREATRCYKEALEHAVKADSWEYIAELNALLAAESSNRGDYKDAYGYLLSYARYSDSLRNDANITKIAELQEKYEVKEKEKNIEKLNAEKAQQQVELYRKKTQVNTILVFSVVTILILSLFYYWYSFRQKNKGILREIQLNTERMNAIEEKRILQEKQQKELLNVVIHAQEEERRKIALDIHDGLGQLLSGIKLKLQLALTGAAISPQTKETLKHIQDLNADSIAESKSITSNLLPYNIRDFGLVAAVKNLCYNSNQLNVSKLTFYAQDVPRKLPGDLEISVYRILQELINNALKHANATEIFVQLFYRENRLILQVEDNGSGFVPADASLKANSMGLKNISSRVHLLGGHLEIDSAPGTGTTTVIEFPLNNS
ncbi:MAG: tetratricopeptide repeat protein [Bacteroidia bacterium]